MNAVVEKFDPVVAANVADTVLPDSIAAFLPEGCGDSVTPRPVISVNTEPSELSLNAVNGQLFSIASYVFIYAILT